MNLTEEKALKALDEIEEATTEIEDSSTIPTITYNEFDNQLIVLRQLIEEHFDNPPLKFEELKEGMWVWDNEQEKYLKIVETVDYDEDFDEPTFLIVFEPNEYDCWVEDRFYRKEVKERRN